MYTCLIEVNLLLFYQRFHCQLCQHDFDLGANKSVFLWYQRFYDVVLKVSGFPSFSKMYD